MAPTPPPPRSAPAVGLPYCKPKEGRDYWVLDGALANPTVVTERLWLKTDWTCGAPRRPESWPGMRAPNALKPEELQPLETWVREQTGTAKLTQEVISETGARLSHNHVQIVGATESGPRPHVDSLRLATYAGVLYLHPHPPAGVKSGTAFYRLRLPSGALSGNTCPPGYFNLQDALGVQKLPPQAWVEDAEVPNVFNRLLVYRADLVHSAAGYFGTEDVRSRRMTVVFFWKVPASRVASVHAAAAIK